jgi:hypothetical protein
MNPIPGLPGGAKTKKEPEQMNIFDPAYKAPDPEDKDAPVTPGEDDLPFTAEPAKPAKPAGLPGGGAAKPGLAPAETFEEDFTDEDGTGGFKIADEGFHPAVVIDFEKTVSKAGNPTYVWQFLIIGGPSEGVEIKYWTSLLPQSRWKSVETLTAIGIPAAGSVVRFTKQDVLKRVCILEVEHEEYDGKTSHTVKKVHAPNEAALALQKRMSPR